MLYLMTFASLTLPLLTLPYLTRVLTKEAYATVAYVKSSMTYIQLIVDFGFILSAVKDISSAGGDRERIGKITGNTILAKLILSAFALGALFVLCSTIEILRSNLTYVILSFLAVAITAFLADFLFRGIERMHYVAVIYVASKSISTALTFFLVRGEGDVLWIPTLDIFGNVIAVIISFCVIKRLGIRICFTGFSDSFALMRNSLVYFLSSIATTAFSALNTLLIGIFMSDDVSGVANWNVCLTIISAIQSLYAPISNGIYPHMIRERSLKFIHKVLAIFMPIVAIGCAVSFIFSRVALIIVGGEEYAEAESLFRLMIPILFFSFPAQIYGWPTLGAIGKAKENTASTVVAAAVQVVGIAALIVLGKFTLVNLAVLRTVTEAALMLIRMWLVYKNKRLFRL